MWVTAEDLTHGFRHGEALFHDLCFTLGPGELCAVTGPSGSGKSTLLGLIAGWIQPRSGQIRRNGAGRICWVFQSPHGVAGRTALDHVVLPLLARDLTRHEAEHRARAILASFRLDQVAHQPYRTLSGGQAQRLMLARTLAADPALVLVDEPTAQLDRAAAHDVIETIAALAGAGRTVLVATHDPGVVAACHRHIDLGAK